jgi:hypothetical protein
MVNPPFSNGLPLEFGAELTIDVVRRGSSAAAVLGAFPMISSYCGEFLPAVLLFCATGS